MLKVSVGMVVLVHSPLVNVLLLDLFSSVLVQRLGFIVDEEEMK